MNNDRSTTALSTRWMCVLVSLLGAFEMLMALSAGSSLVRVVGVVGGLALAAAPWVARRVRGVTLVLLVVGTVPFAALTVTSLVTSVLAIVAWILMGLVHRDRTRLAPSAPTVPPRPAHHAGVVPT
jgi:uncharacterized protein (UPF0264 family)